MIEYKRLMFNLAKSFSDVFDNRFENISATFLQFRRIYTNGDLFYLANESVVLIDRVFNTEEWMSQKCFMDLTAFGKSSEKTGIFFWFKDFCNEALKIKGSCHDQGIHLFKKSNNFTDIYTFSCQNENLLLVLLDHFLKNKNEFGLQLLDFLNLISDYVLNSKYYIKTNFTYQMGNFFSPFDEKASSFRVRIKIKDSFFTFTKRELQILNQISIGKTVKEVAAVYHLSPGTIRKHIDNLKWKTGFLTTHNLIDLYWDHISLYCA